MDHLSANDLPRQAMQSLNLIRSGYFQELLELALAHGIVFSNHSAFVLAVPYEDGIFVLWASGSMDQLRSFAKFVQQSYPDSKHLYWVREIKGDANLRKIPFSKLTRYV